MSQICVTKLSRHLSHKTHRRHRSIKRIRSDNIIHVTTRGSFHDPSANRMFTKPNNSPGFLHSTPNIFDSSHNDHKFSKKAFISQNSTALSKSVTNSVRVTKIHKISHSTLQLGTNTRKSTGNKASISEKSLSVLPTDSDRMLNNQSILKTHDSVSPSFNRTGHKHSLLNDDDNHTKTKGIWSNELGAIDDHHRDSNKKKICSSRCIIISVIGAIIIISVIVVAISLVLLIKPKKASISPPPAILRWNESGITIVGTGIPGTKPNQLQQPWDLVLDWSNTLYITDRGNNRVQKFLMGEKNATTVCGQANGTAGTSATSLSEPTGIYVDEKSNMYISDKNNGRFQFWSNDSLTGVTLLGNGTSGNGITQLNLPYGVARDLNSGVFYIADYNNNRIMSYAYGASSGILVAGGNGLGKNNNQLSNPTGIFYDSLSNSLVITNVDSNNVVRWTLGENHWEIVAGSINGTQGTSSTLLNEPTDVTFDPMGNMYVADRSNQRIQFFLAGQSDGITLAGRTGVSGSNSTQFNGPSSLILDNQLNLYVTDRGNNRVQKFVRY